MNNDQDLFISVCRSVADRLQECVNCEGGHFGHLLDQQVYLSVHYEFYLFCMYFELLNFFFCLLYTLYVCCVYVYVCIWNC